MQQMVRSNRFIKVQCSKFVFCHRSRNKAESGFKSTKINSMFTVQVFTFSPIQENTYVLVNQQGEGLVIDPGCYGEDEQDALAGFFTQNGVQPKLLLQTHCHLDHVFGTRWLAGAYGLI